MAHSCRNHRHAAIHSLTIIQALCFTCALLSPSPVFSTQAFPCDLFFEISSDFADGSSKAMECTLQFFCLNTSAACGCSDASQPMFSFDVPFRFSDVDDLQTGFLSGDVTILPSSKDNKTEAAAAFDAKNQTEGGMCALMNSGFFLKMQGQRNQGRIMRSLVLSIMGQDCDGENSMSMFSDSLSFSAITDGDEPSGTPVNIVSLFPGPSKLAIPRTVSFQVQLTNLAAVGSPLYVSFNRAYRQSSNPFHPPEAPIAVWELDGWWQTPEPVADGGSFMTVITVVLSGVIVAGFLIYRCFFGASGRERRAQLKMTTARMRNLFARNLHKRAERKEREREERKPIFQEDATVGKGSAMDMDTFLDIGADDDEETPGRL